MQRRRRLVIRTLLAILSIVAVGSVSRETAAQPLRTVAFVDAVKFPPKATQAHLRLRAFVEEALPSKSLFLVQTRRPIPDCGDSPSGMAKVAADHNAQYVMRIAGQKSHEYGYDIVLGVYSTTLASVRTSLATCDICDPGRMAEVASKAAAELLSSVLREEVSLKEAPKAPLAAPPPVALPPPPPVAPPSTAPAPPAPIAYVAPPPVVETARHRWIPWTAIGVGALAAGFGIYALSQDGSVASYKATPAGETRERYSSMGLGVACTAVGGLLLVGGAIWVIATPARSTTLSLSPTRIALNVRF